MSLKLLVATALAATAAVDDTIFDASIKAEAAANALEDLQKYLDAAPKTAAELVAGCGDHYACYSQLYVFTRSKLEDFAQTAFAAGCAHGYATEQCAVPEPLNLNPVHDYHNLGMNACAGDYESAAQPGPAPAATPIRTSEAAVDLQFSDGTCVSVRVAGK